MPVVAFVPRPRVDSITPGSGEMFSIFRSALVALYAMRRVILSCTGWVEPVKVFSRVFSPGREASTSESSTRISATTGPCCALSDLAQRLATGVMPMVIPSGGAL